MGLLSKVVERVSDHPRLFIFFRSLLENDFRSIRALCRRELRFGKNSRTLEIACGPGTFADLFDGDDYVGLDRNRRYVEYARQAGRGTFMVGDARKIDLPDASFDQVLIFGLLHHLPDEDARAVLLECKRLLVPGGRALVIEDIPAVSKMNLIGHLIHNVENGEYIRPADAYRTLYSQTMRIELEEVLKSGICDYYAVVLVA